MEANGDDGGRGVTRKGKEIVKDEEREKVVGKSK